MQTFTFAWWRWRLAQAFGRNPLVRTTDRIEALAMAMAVAACLIAVPVAAALATAIHDERGRAYATQLEDLERVVATATRDSVPLPRSQVTVVEARWQYGGVQRAERFQWTEPVRAGQTIDVWVHPDGRRAAQMDPWWRAGVEAAVAGISFWLAVAATAALMVGLARPCLRRVRYAAWERDIASLADEGGTTNRRP
ncbi:hypothetical protein ABGB19_25770 [Mycobacterium sp. B14F4]|uniref:Rv1733c family protein n=1 Tax=Mycobacterium sp. B14F4 TaxID=3153565 RepID=UPI00325D15D2